MRGKRRVLCLSNTIPLLGEGARCRDCSMPTVTHPSALALMLEAGFIRSSKMPRYTSTFLSFLCSEGWPMTGEQAFLLLEEELIQWRGMPLVAPALSLLPP